MNKRKQDPVAQVTAQIDITVDVSQSIKPLKKILIFIFHHSNHQSKNTLKINLSMFKIYKLDRD